jgi:hypothetical protein
MGRNMLRPYGIVRAGRARRATKTGRLLSRPRLDMPAQAGWPCPNTGEASAGDQTITRGIRGIVAFHFADVFDAALIADELRQTLDELRAIFGDEPGIRLEQLIHVLPAANAIRHRRARGAATR